MAGDLRTTGCKHRPHGSEDVDGLGSGVTAVRAGNLHPILPGTSHNDAAGGCSCGPQIGGMPSLRIKYERIVGTNSKRFVGCDQSNRPGQYNNVERIRLRGASGSVDRPHGIAAGGRDRNILQRPAVAPPPGSETVTGVQIQCISFTESQGSAGDDCHCRIVEDHIQRIRKTVAAVGIRHINPVRPRGVDGYR